MDKSTSNQDLHPKTVEYINNTDIEYRKENGQYFTPQPLISGLFQKLPSELRQCSDLDILDPALGTGEFILNALDVFDMPNIEGWELDEELYSVSKEILPETVDLTNTNSLFYEPNKKYDLIIGNPPYYEITQSDKIKKHYDRVLYGRTNIYSLFIYKSLELLKEGGYLAFINPPSMNNGAYFKELRDYIVKNCSIEHISIHENSELFEDASQSVMYLVIKKGNEHNDYVFSKNNITIFSEDADYLRSQFENCKTLSELGYKVTTGSLVWNQNKSKLQEDPTDETIPIIWSKNIKEGTLEIGSDVHSKPQYIKGVEANTGPAVVVNRVVGKPGEGSIRAGLIESGVKFIGENHVNVIQPTVNPNQEQLTNPEITLTEILNQLNLDENVEVVQKITGNNQISKTELQELFPIQPTS